MKVEVGIVEVLNARVAVAFVDGSYIDTEAGKELLADISMRLSYLTPAPLMLYSADGRSFAPFQTHKFAARIRREYVVEWLEIDLAKPYYEYEGEAPF